ncbi:MULTISPECIES: cell division protein FtsQ/DivIB [Psychrilyobacter]|nr:MULTISPECIES: cell division protein FtsQ/DivIB [Psychrilyobacter]MCS5421551.1 cell division protein FtsQ/DivIB [Psychrilyobacter sp. S5]NDI78674.1 FtsQ-type POTRA domain-containing protein [Psychrilyobacter piezotolerans]
MKKILQIIFIGIICWYTYTEYGDFKKASLFDVTEVNINVKNLELIDDLVKGIKTLKGRNILEIDKEKMKEKILEDVRVKDVVIKTWMPDILIFNIKEKEPFVYIEYRGKIYISDELGKVYGYMKESKKYNMPLFRIDHEDEIKKFIEIMEKISFKDEISQVYKVDNGIAITTNTGLKIITNIDVATKKYGVVKKLYDQVRPKNRNKKQIEYIDLRFEDYIIKRVEGDQR